MAVSILPWDKNKNNGVEFRYFVSPYEEDIVKHIEPVNTNAASTLSVASWLLLWQDITDGSQQFKELVMPKKTLIDYVSSLQGPYQICGESEQLNSFLNKYPELVPIIEKTNSEIKKYFSEAIIALLMAFPGDSSQDNKAMIMILTSDDWQVANEKLNEFDQKYWLELLDTVYGKLFVNIGFVE